MTAEETVRKLWKYNREDFIDSCGEVNYTKLAESACEEADDYDDEYNIPEAYFDAAAKVVIMDENVSVKVNSKWGIEKITFKKK